MVAALPYGTTATYHDKIKRQPLTSYYYTPYCSTATRTAFIGALSPEKLKKKDGGWSPPLLQYNLYRYGTITDRRSQTITHQWCPYHHEKDGGYHSLPFHHKFNVGDKQTKTLFWGLLSIVMAYVLYNTPHVRLRITWWHNPLYCGIIRYIN